MVRSADLFDCLGAFRGRLDGGGCPGHLRPRGHGLVPMLLAHLEQCSLVVPQTDEPDPRYDMLETVRALASAHLDEAKSG